MTTVTFFACLLSGPCEPVAVAHPEMTPLFCHLGGGVQAAAAWRTQHPQYRIEGPVRCLAGVRA